MRYVMFAVFILMIAGVLSPLFVAGRSEQVPRGQPLLEALNSKDDLY